MRYYCTCGRRFISPSHLRSHVRHECGKTFHCEICGKSLSTKKQIPLHVKLCHADEATKKQIEDNLNKMWSNQDLNNLNKMWSTQDLNK